MTVIAELTFGQELIKELVGAVSTAALVTVVGSVVATTWSRKRDARRERFALRTQILENATRIAADMNIACQHTRRLIKIGVSSPEQSELVASLDQQYQKFAVEAAVLSEQIGARYGFHQTLLRREPARNETYANGRAWERWHQIQDLLALYYFNLVGMRPDVMSDNSLGHGGRYHSGIDLGGYVDDTEASRSGMRKAIRSTYREAMSDFVQCVLSDEVRVEGDR